MSEKKPYHYHAQIGELDLYDVFIQLYGHNAWCRHVEMEAIQYIYRHTRKGTPQEDLDKVRGILDRLDAERTKHTGDSKTKPAEKST